MAKRKRILIADDDESLVDVAAKRFECLGLRVDRAYDGMSTLQKIEEREPDLMILDVNMPGGSGLGVCQMLSRDANLKSIPVIVLTGRKDPETIRVCRELHAHYVQKGTDMWSRLEPLVMGLLELERAKWANSEVPHPGSVHGAKTGDSIPDDDRGLEQMSPPPPPASDAEAGAGSYESAGRIPEEHIDAILAALGVRGRETSSLEAAASKDVRPGVLCVDDDRDFADSLKLRLEQHGVAVVQAFAGMDGYCTAFAHPVQAIILDLQLPDGDGEYVLRRLKENPVTQNIPVIVLTGAKDRALERRMYNLGAAQFLAKPVAWDDLWHELQRHLRLPAQPPSPINSDLKRH
ncbi:MAG TPA: response regulator [Pirellulales bacterium]|nr:response regulator [Pirellulales bacterium]